VTYTNWNTSTGEPNNGRPGGENAAVMNFQNPAGWYGKWNDYPVDEGCTFEGPLWDGSGPSCTGLAGIVEVDANPQPGWFALEASLSGPWIHGQAWNGDLAQGDQATVEVTGAGVPEGAWIGNDTVAVEGGHGSFEVFPPFALEPGMSVTATASGITKTLVLEPLSIDTIDRQTGVVTGTAPPNLAADERLHVDTDVSPDSSGTYIGAMPGTDGDGNWTVDFDQPLVPGNDTGADLRDEDGDTTIFDMMVPGPPFFILEVNDDAIYGGGPDNAWVGPVTITVLRGDETLDVGQVPLYVDPEDPQEGSFWHEFSSPNEGLDAFDFRTGDVVTVTDGVNTKVLTLTPLDVTVDGDMIGGICSTATNPMVWIHSSSEGPLVETACSTEGTFDATGLIDIESFGGVSQVDDDGDVVSFTWAPPEPFDGNFAVNISTGEDGHGQYVAGWGWDGPVTIILEGEAIGTASTDPEGFFFWWDESGTVRFGPGDAVAIVDTAGNERDLSLAHLAVTDIAPLTGRVAGTCEVGMDVNLEYSTDDAHPNPTQLVVPCNGGAFQGWFAPNELPDYPKGSEQSQCCSYVEARQFDEEWDSTQVDAWYEYPSAYDWTGFFRPVDNAPTLNTVKAGSAIPVKFSLGGYFGLDVITVGSSNVACSALVGGVDAIEQTVTAGGGTLSYDAPTDTYGYVWKTNKTWIGTCRQLTVTLGDGSEHLASFRFTK
jgi:hypothetical protein